ncbi:hypothetical protein FACS189451_05780 [Bacteroidia bacterium]|nr:hypothetical protein FACS189446_6470 [Bacteroidia bacterium]GHT62144.1 hypothetical protein FACS189451_05780 [Bacteroidia bacterium]
MMKNVLSKKSRIFAGVNLQKQKENIMATPIRMAPVLYGKDAEFFYEQWAKMWEKPLKKPITKEDQEKWREFIERNRKNM